MALPCQPFHTKVSFIDRLLTAIVALMSKLIDHGQ